MDEKFFKSKEIQAGFEKVEFRLRVIVMSLAGLMLMTFGRMIVITSTFRPDPPGKPKSVHGDGRGCDVRCKDWSQEERDFAEAYLQTFYYRGAFKTVLIHGKGSNIHFHIQTSWGDPYISFIQDRVIAMKELLAQAPEKKDS